MARRAPKAMWVTREKPPYLKKKEEKTCLCKRYALIWDISSANPPFLIVIKSVDLVKNLVEVFLKGYLG